MHHNVLAARDAVLLFEELLHPRVGDRRFGVQLFKQWRVIGNQALAVYLVQALERSLQFSSSALVIAADPTLHRGFVDDEAFRLDSFPQLEPLQRWIFRKQAAKIVIIGVEVFLALADRSNLV